MRPETKLRRKDTRVKEKPHSTRQRIKVRGKENMSVERARVLIQRELAPGYEMENV